MSTALPVLLLFLEGFLQHGLPCMRYAPYVPLWPTLCDIERPSILSGITISSTTWGPFDWFTRREQCTPTLSWNAFGIA
jgi:hypothetical protein